MKRLKLFLTTTLLGGLIVILPVAILISVFGWLFNFVTKFIQPLTNLITARADIREVIADILVLLIILCVCFFIGLLIRTRFGKFLHEFIEVNILKIAPGYTLIKETILQILGNKQSPFSKVALVQIFANETRVTAFVTDEHSNGSYSVFVPTGPNPTSGNIYHLDAKYVHVINVSVEDAMKSIISCGAGSSKLVNASNTS